MGSDTAEDKLGVAYIRVSMVGDRGDDLLSPDLQRFAIQEYAKREGIQIVEEVQDIDKSGRDFSKRRVGQIIEGITAGKWKYVLLWKWSRWGRNMRQSQLHLGRVEDAGGIVRAATEDFDSQTTMGRFTRDQMLLVAQLQSDMISDSWKETQASRRRVGLPHAAGKRFGYTYDKATGYKPDPALAPMLKNFYERYVAGDTHYRMATELNAAGIPTTRGRRWSRDSVAKAMDTGFAAGLIREKSEPGDSRASGGKHARSIWAWDIWREGSHEAIISADLWTRYYDRRLAQCRMAPRLRIPAHSLSGLLQCGECGASMVAHYPGRSPALSWTCRRNRDTKLHAPNYLANVKAEEAVLKWLGRNAGSSHSVTEEARRLERGRRAKGIADGLDKEIGRLVQKRRRLTDAMSDGDVDRDDFREQKAAIDKDIAEKTVQRDDARAREKASGVSLIRQFGVLAKEWPRFTPADRREALLGMVSVIKVFPGKDYEDALDDGKLVPVPFWEDEA